MNPELEKKPLQSPKKEKTMAKLLAQVWHSLRHNLLWKLLAVVLAVLMWAGLISQDPSLIREKVFTDVPVSITGADSLKNNRMIVTTDLTSEPPTVRMKADVPQMEYSSATAANYNPRIDLSRIREKGTQTVKILTTTTATYGSVVELSPDTIEVEVDEYKTRYRIPTVITPTGSYPDDYYADGYTISPGNVNVSGPKSLVDRVRSAVAVFDKGSVNTAQRKYATSVPFELLDENGDVIESNLISVTSESISLDSLVVEVELYPTKTITLSGMGLTKGTPEKGYEVKKVTVSPSAIRAAGTKEILEQFAIESLFLDQAVDLTGKTETFNEVIKVRKPTEIKNLNPDSVTVSVEIGLKNTEVQFDNITLEAIDLPQGFSATSETRKGSVKVSGPEIYLEKLKASDIKLTYSLKGLSQGVSQVPVECQIAALNGVSYTFTLEPQMVTVELKQK